VVLVNARDVKHMPGRKTDVNDAQWLQRLQEYYCCGPAFVQSAGSPHCATICASGTAAGLCGLAHPALQKALMQMNLQLHQVVSDITGATGVRIIRALVAGERDPAGPVAGPALQGVG
jgi:transposase